MKLSVTVLTFLSAAAVAAADPPAQFDLRDVGPTHENHVTSVKSQTGGTCWTHGSMAAFEGNLLRSGTWQDLLDSGYETVAEPNLAEYHLDWWNGFNEHHNDDTDPPNGNGNGLNVHYGGDYRVVTAYATRGDGAVYSAAANDGGEGDTPWYSSAPARSDPSYHVYAPHDVEWYVAGSDLSNLDTIKQAVMDHGVLGTCMYYGGGYYSSSTKTHYQPPSDSRAPNHSIAIVGWDDTKSTQAPQDGAWLCKNSWGSGWGDGGYFWISYYDKHAGQDPQMGAVSFQGVAPNPYDTIHSHDLHGWRAELIGPPAVCNAFTAAVDEHLTDVSLYTTADDVDYTVRVYDRFEGGALLDELTSAAGTFAHTGYHTVALDTIIALPAGDDFYVYVELSNDEHAFDRTSQVPVLLGDLPPPATDGRIVSDAEPGQSYYFDGVDWLDLFDYEIIDPDLGDVTGSANFCIRALAKELAAGDCDGDRDVDDADLSLLLSGYGMAAGGAWGQGDFDADGDVDPTDLDSLLGAFGSATAPTSPGQVPAPATLGLLAVGAAALRRRRR